MRFVIVAAVMGILIPQVFCTTASESSTTVIDFNAPWLPQRMAGGMREPRRPYNAPPDAYQIRAREWISNGRVLALEMAMAENEPHQVLYDIAYHFARPGHSSQGDGQYDKGESIVRRGVFKRQLTLVRFMLDIQPRLAETLTYPYRRALVNREPALQRWMDDELDVNQWQPDVGRVSLLPISQWQLHREIREGLMPLMQQELLSGAAHGEVLRAEFELIQAVISTRQSGKDDAALLERAGEGAYNAFRQQISQAERSVHGLAYEIALKHAVKHAIGRVVLQLVWQGTAVSDEAFNQATAGDSNHMLRILLALGARGDREHRFMRLAVQHGRAENVGSLLSWFADVEHDHFPLMQHAMDTGRSEVVVAFLKHGTEQWQYAERALEYAEERGLHQMASLIRANSE